MTWSMHTDGSIAKYEHPYVTVDGVLFRVKSGDLQVKLCRNDDVDAWCLPGGFVPVDRLAEDVLRDKMRDKAGVDRFYAEQLRTYDALDRDWRGRVISIAYLCLTSDLDGDDGWFALDGEFVSRTDGDSVEIVALDALGFDHGSIVMDARERLTNKLWYSDLPKHLLPPEFRIADIQGLYEMLEGSNYYGNFKRDMGKRIVPVGEKDDGRPGRKAVLYKWLGLGFRK